MKTFLTMVAVVLLGFGTSGGASAQGKICKICEPHGNACCALQGSVSACVTCSVGYGYKNPEPWCRRHVPACKR